VKQARTPEYSRIVLWIRDKYGTRFTPGMDDTEVRREIDRILKEERARGVPHSALRGLRGFIGWQRQNTRLIDSRR
jgi:hypothetical protein